ncbi:hypothetical protein Tco_0501632 [Tanacetum coccineum]
MMSMMLRVGIKSLLNAASITAAHIRVNYEVNAAEGVNAASEEVSTAELGKYCKLFRTPWCIKGGSRA